MVRVSIFSTVAGLAGFMALAAPAQAFDDRPSTLAPIMNMITGSDEKANDIDFRERPPLVVPKNLELQQPRPGAPSARVGNWPKDQEVARRSEEAARARVPQQIEVNKNPALDKNELMKGQSDAPGVAVNMCDTYVSGIQDCAPTSMEKLKRVFTIGDANRDVVVVGKEPSREYLTEPPKGYRNASETTKATVQGGYERDDAADAGKYYRDIAKRNSEYR